MATLNEARKDALSDINLLRALVKQTNAAGIDVILKSVPIKQIVLNDADLKELLHELKDFKSERLTAAQLVEYYNCLEQRLVTDPHKLQKETTPPSGWRG